MSPIEILKRFWDLLAQRRREEAIALLEPNGQFWSRPIGYVPMEAFIYIMSAVQDAAPMTFAIRSELEKGDRAIIEFQGYGVFAESGEIYENNYIFVADVCDGLMVDLREYSDSAYSNEVFGRNLPQKVLEIFGGMVAQARVSRDRS